MSNSEYNQKCNQYDLNDLIKDLPPVYWSFANYIYENPELKFLKLKLKDQETVYKKWYDTYYDIFDMNTSKLFALNRCNILDLNKIRIELSLAQNTFYVNENTRNKNIPSHIGQIICETESSIHYGFHKLYRTIPRKNLIHTIYFGMNGLGCNGDDYYTKTHIDNENNSELPQLFTPENKKLLQRKFEQVLEKCPKLVRIHICGYFFQCDTDTLFFKINKHIKVHKIYNYEYSKVDSTKYSNIDLNCNAIKNRNIDISDSESDSE